MLDHGGQRRAPLDQRSRTPRHPCYKGPAISGYGIARGGTWPAVERPSEHIRQVKPGNFRKHLNRKSIELLNAEFEHLLTEYNYAF